MTSRKIKIGNFLRFSQSKNQLQNILISSSLSLLSFIAAAAPLDSDGDGMPDDWEMTYSLNPFDSSDAMQDSDWDNVLNKDEYLFGIDPTNPDSDNDFLDDAMEIELGFNPASADTDNDLIPDGWEYNHGLNPLFAEDALFDFDDDNLTNYDEFLLGSNPRLVDTDGDQLADGVEVSIGTSPIDADTDGDGLSDNESLDFMTDPLMRDSNQNGIIDGFEHGSIIIASDKITQDGPGESSGAALSDNGRFIVFVSESNAIVTNDNNQAMDVFWMDLLTGERRLISRAWDGGDSNGWSGRIVNGIGIDISGDGQRVVFQSGASNITQNDVNGTSSDIYLHNIQTGNTRLINIDNNGVQSNGTSWSPKISSNGQFITFRSSATSLLSNADNNAYNSDVFLHDLTTGKTELISLNDEGIQSNANSEGATPSNDGRFVSFLSKANNLVADDSNSSSYNDVFIRDRLLATTVRVNLDENGNQMNGGAIYDVDFSGNGRFVTFSTTIGLVEADQNGQFDCYRRDLQSHSITLISDSLSNIKCVTPKISESGRFVTFELLQGISNTGYGIYVKDLMSGEVKLVSKANGATSSPYYSRGKGLDISADGQLVQFALRAPLTPEASHQQEAYVALSGMPMELKGPKLITAVLNNVSTDSWTEVSLDTQYQSMMVVATPQYTSDQPPMAVRIRNAANNKFEIKLDRVDASQTPVTDISVHYFVLEEGIYTSEEHGVKMEAVKFNSTVTAGNKNWRSEARSYQNSYDSPVVLGQVMSSNDSEFSTFWSHGANRTSPADSNNLNVGKQVAEDPNNSRTDETIGYVVFEQGAGLINGVKYTVGLGADSIVGLQNGARSYSHEAVDMPISAVASLAAMDGADGGWAILMSSPDETTISLGIEEDQLNDSERSHTKEQVGYIVFH